MSTSPQQQAVITELQQPGYRLVKTSAVAGSGKTYLAIEAAKALGLKGRYLAYNKAIASEAAEKFKGTGIECSTLHSLAWRAVVRQYGLKVGWFGYRDVEYNGSTTEKKEIAALIEGFCLCGEITPAGYFGLPQFENVDKDLITSAEEHIHGMADGTITCNHSFYLKMYHGLLTAGTIPPVDTGFLILDEAGDVTPVSLAIFKAITAEKKLMVGDTSQNIYKFNNTINGFHALKSEGVELPLTTSYRVSSKIAKPVQAFMRNFVDTSFKFTGTTYTDDTVDTMMYISRYNTTLIAAMLTLQSAGESFNTTRPVKLMLELPLILARIDNGKKITNTRYRVLENLRNRYTTSATLRSRYRTIQQYISVAMKDDEEVVRGIKLLGTHGRNNILSLEAYAVQVASPENTLTLTTAHSSKGLEADEVKLADDMNDVVKQATTNHKTALKTDNTDLLDKANTEFLLYYVACTRAKKSLLNATQLPTKPYL